MLCRVDVDSDAAPSGEAFDEVAAEFEAVLSHFSFALEDGRISHPKIEAFRSSVADKIDRQSLAGKNTQAKLAAKHKAKLQLRASDSKSISSSSEVKKNLEEEVEAFKNLPFDTLSPVLVAVKAIPADKWFSEEFWPHYWRKVDRVNSLKTFRKYATDEETKDRIIAAVKAQSAQYMARSSEHRPHAATWLNAKRYEEDPEVYQPAMSKLDRIFEAI